MRIWSIHPGYLDAKGLVALWRESLLAKKVLEGETKGYRNHPQLQRFQLSEFPLDNINHYLSLVYAEAVNRNYVFNKEKLNWNHKKNVLTVTRGQLAYERNHLLTKLKVRDQKQYSRLKEIIRIEANPLFKVVTGDVEFWEMV